MGHSRAEKAKTHKRILNIASRRLREEGLSGVGINEVMKEAGLTVGGFYKHFQSRDALVADAVSSCLGTWRRRLDAAQAGGPPFSYEELVDDYLTQSHRDRPGTGCVISALAGEIPRSGKRARSLISQQIRNNVELITGLLPDKDKRKARAKAILTQCALIGAVTLARAIPEDRLSREILATVQAALKRGAADRTRRTKRAPSQLAAERATNRRQTSTAHSE